MGQVLFKTTIRMGDNIEGKKRRLSGDGQYLYQVLGIEKGMNMVASLTLF